MSWGEATEHSAGITTPEKQEERKDLPEEELGAEGISQGGEIAEGGS